MTADEMRDLLAAQIPACGASGDETTILCLLASAGLAEETWLDFLETYMSPIAILVTAGYGPVLLDLFQAAYAVGKLSATQQPQQASKIN